MKISLKWLAKYIDLRDLAQQPDKISELLTQGGLEVEGITDQGASLKNVVVAKILEKEKHPQADNLTLCKVSTGNETHQIVCGAKNHKAGDIAVLALPGAVLPGNFEIKISKIRGIESQGMLCSEKELGIAAQSEGIMILPESAPVGEPFSKYAHLDDVLFDIKVTPNRADCLSHLGLARELCSLLGRSLEFPTIPAADGRESTKKLVRLSVEDTDRCPRYAGRAVMNVKVGPSPEWLKKSLEAVGLRSINNVVDVTNYVMMELGQPLHAFDLEKVEGKHVVVRPSQPGETMVALDDRELKFDGSELVICDAKRPIALAGVMGSKESGVTDSTKDIFVESAYFVPWTVRRTSRLHGMDSDSSYRFCRGIDPDQVVVALNRACQLLSEVAQGQVCSDHHDHYPRPLVRPRIEIDLKYIGARLGIPIEGVEAKRLLERVGCDVSGSGQKLLVNPPAYRGDLKLAEDLGEEILRLKGYHNIPETIPAVTKDPTPHHRQFDLEEKLSRDLRSLGVSQAVNLSFLSSDFQKKVLGDEAGEKKEWGLTYKAKPVFLKNPLNQDLNAMRLSILPGLLKNLAFNVRHGNKSGRLFEIGPVFWAEQRDDLQGPRPYSEEARLGIVLWGENEANWIKSSGVPLVYRIKGILESLLDQWGLRSYQFDPLKTAASFLHPGQSGRIFAEGKSIGIFGTLHPGLLQALEVDVEAVGVEISLEGLFAGQPRVSKMKPLPKFPSVTRDVAFLADRGLAAADIKKELLKGAGALAVQCECFDVFEGKGVPQDKKSLAFRLVYLDPQKTLSDDEVNATHKKAVDGAVSKLGVSVR
ncbi:MAG: phenylalanine--tRNA ligase subunit beta [Oligoflexia bacterium]|nr:phenylalanine--tRNA ligase subunit beta [Oligoflexia bacterium]